jgi:hypothetical protein
MNFRSYVISVIWLVFQVRFSVKWPFSKKNRSNDLLINFVHGQMNFFGKIFFRSNGLRFNGDSVKCTFGQMAFDGTVFDQKAFRSNGLSVKICLWNYFSVKWSRTHLKWKMSEVDIRFPNLSKFCWWGQKMKTENWLFFFWKTDIFKFINK